MTKPTKEQLAEWRKLCNEARQPPWRLNDYGTDILEILADGNEWIGDLPKPDRATADFLIAARTTLPILLDRVDELEEEQQKDDAFCCECNGSHGEDARMLQERVQRLVKANKELKAQLKELEQQLGNLLAVIHRDGGHHQMEVGTEQAVDDAHKVWAEMQQQLDGSRGLRQIKEQQTTIARAQGALADAGDIPADDIEAGIRLLTEQRDYLRQHLAPYMDSYNDNQITTCGHCGGLCEVVRPGKTQCRACEVTNGT